MDALALFVKETCRQQVGKSDFSSRQVSRAKLEAQTDRDCVFKNLMT
jgi:hypothetical protein